MKETDQLQPHPAGTPGVPQYASFILRCWTGEGGQIHVRLIDVNTGVGQAVADVADLPQHVRRLMSGIVLPVPEEEGENA
jgi:hypothetical protein